MNYFYEPVSIDDMLKNTKAKYGSRMFAHELVDGQFNGKTHGEFIADVHAAASQLISAGYGGKSIMLQGKNTYEWLVLYIAIIGYVGICICASKDWKAYDLSHAIEVTSPDLILYDMSVADLVESLDKSFLTMPFHQILHADSQSADIDLGKQRIPGNTTSMIVFTTGTTALPKAVTLSFGNAMANGQNLYSRIPITPDDVYYLFLPFHHIYAQACIIFAALLLGAQVYISYSVQNAKEELLLSKPTIIPGVPLFFDRILDAFTDQQRRTAQQADVLLTRFHAPRWLRRRVFKDFHDALGGQVQCLTSGAARLDSSTKQFLRSTGLTVIEGYGMSETCGVISVEYDHDSPLGSVGRPLEHMQVTIQDPDKNGFGEIAVKGKNVMQGYIVNCIVNPPVLNDSGFFITGDIGRFDQAGNLYIKGRADKVLVLSSGEKVSIDELTKLVKKGNNEIRKVYFSEENGYVSAKIFTLQSEKLLQKHLSKLNSLLPRYKQIRHYSVIRDLTESEVK